MSCTLAHVAEAREVHHRLPLASRRPQGRQLGVAALESRPFDLLLERDDAGTDEAGELRNVAGGMSHASASSRSCCLGVSFSAAWLLWLFIYSTDNVACLHEPEWRALPARPRVPRIDTVLSRSHWRSKEGSGKLRRDTKLYSNTICSCVYSSNALGRLHACLHVCVKKLCVLCVTVTVCEY